MKSISQQIVELLGPPHCWHGPHIGDMRCPIVNPNYETDPVALLRVIEERED